MDYHDRMLEDQPGNVMITAGNNKRNAEYTKAAVEAGINVLCDKPMCIDQKGWHLLKSACETAKTNQVLIYDIMTARFEITKILHRILMKNPDIFGTLQKGTPENPAVVKESIHHLFKYVAGTPLKRPAEFFDVTQQGEGIVDVATHFVDLVMWECFPGKIIDYSMDIEILAAKRWPTRVTREQFEQVTGLADFPEYLSENLDGTGDLLYYGNGEILYKIKGVHIKISVRWDFIPPSGAGDMHFSAINGSNAYFTIREGERQISPPEFSIKAAEAINPTTLDAALVKAVYELQSDYPGVNSELTDSRWQIHIPAQYHLGHEAHFGKVAEKFLEFLTSGGFPSWEVPNMLTKYYTTTKALELAKKSHTKVGP
jgi:predicted dehydrogenase